jgi:hypothetical protein
MELVAVTYPVMSRRVVAAWYCLTPFEHKQITTILKVKLSQIEPKGFIEYYTAQLLNHVQARQR